MSVRPFPLFLPCLVMSAALAAQDPKPVHTVLDDWHRAAAQADEARYFGCMAEDAVFMGTDATERWVKKDFQVWSHPFFAKGKAWRFKAIRRAVAFSPDGRTAWFDEDLDTPNMGPCRGTGVLSLQGDRWMIRHYNLTVPIPNALMNEVKGRIETHLKKALVP
ncbi:MAG TPA: nuclear transport factor 2 family protein [Holophagaceae bacterium]|nr:nuclear transport factor 2 family protein [Holophagaceae bacterium]